MGDFETGDLSQWPSVGSLDKLDYAVGAETDRKAGGRFAGRMEVRYLDRGFNSDGSPTKVRAEVFEKPVRNGTEWWYGWSSMIDPQWQDQSKTWFIIQQFHQNNMGSPPLYQRYAGGKWSIRCLQVICGGNGVLWEERIPRRPVGRLRLPDQVVGRRRRDAADLEGRQAHRRLSRTQQLRIP